MSCPRAIDVRFFLLFVSLAVVLGVAVGCDDSSASLAPETTADATPTVTRQRVETVVVRSGALEAKDRTSGVVHAFHKARVTAEIQARVLRRAVESGDRVEAGQVLVELDATRLELEVQHAEATLRAHSNDLRHAQREHDRGEKLVSNNAISTQQRDDLRHNLDSASTARDLARVMRDTSKRNLEDAQIRAPFAGSVDSLAVDVGDYVSQGSAVATVVELSRARVFAGVTAQEAARLTGATVAWVQFTALGGGEVEAELKSVGNVAHAMGQRAAGRFARRDGRERAIADWQSCPAPARTSRRTDAQVWQPRSVRRRAQRRRTDRPAAYAADGSKCW
jgi:RND family efflux transporter MFP subunit